MRCEIEGNNQNDTTLIIYSYDKTIRDRLGFWRDKYTFRLGNFLDNNEAHLRHIGVEMGVPGGNLSGYFDKQYLNESLAIWIKSLVENLDERRHFHGMKQLIADIFNVDGKYYKSLYWEWMESMWRDTEDAENLMLCWGALNFYDYNEKKEKARIVEQEESLSLLKRELS